MQNSRTTYLIPSMKTRITSCYFILMAVMLFSFVYGPLTAQNIGIGASTFTPSTIAMLEIQSTSSGLLIPRMTNAQRTSLAPGAAANVGLLIFQTDIGASIPTGIGFYYWNGTVWVPLLANASTTTGAWDLRGNAGTVVGTNFQGTTDNIPLNFKVNNQKAGRIDPAGPVFFGYQAGINNANANSTAIGYKALCAANTGADNIAIGQYALYANTSGTQNTAIGDGALKLSVGGSNNTAIGYQAATLISSTGAGDNNTVIGSKALAKARTGSDNTVIGFLAAQQTDGASYNIVVGSNALYTNITGVGNTSFGYQASYYNTVVNYDVAIGFKAGPNGSLAATSSANNVYAGANAGAGNWSGNNSIFIGSGATSTATGLSNAIALGNGASISASNTMVLGNSNITKWGFGVNTSAGNILEFRNALTTACLTTGGVWTSTSDSTLKTNIHNLNYGLKEVLRLRPVSYTLKKNGRNDIGFLAQEVKEIIPEIIYGESGNMSMSYGQLTAVLVKAMKEQQGSIEEIKTSLGKLQTEVLGIPAIPNQKDNLQKGIK